MAFSEDYTVRKQEIRAVAVEAAARVLHGSLPPGASFALTTLELAEKLERYISHGS